MLARSGDHQPVPAASSTISPWIGQGVEPAAGHVQLGVPDGVVDAAALVAAAAQVPVVVLARARLVVRDQRGFGLDGRASGASRALARVRLRLGPPPGSGSPRLGHAFFDRHGPSALATLRDRLAEPEPQEPVVAGLAEAVGAELRPALEVVGRPGGVRPPRTTGTAKLARNGIAGA